MAESKKAFYGHIFRYVAQVLEVIDGDTLRVDLDMGMCIKQSPKIFRLSGVNAPESRTSNAAEKKRGLAAKSYLQYLTPVDSWIMIVTDRDVTEKYGRIFGKAYAEPGAASINDQMVKAGHSKQWDGQGEKPV
ncbi:MAG: thermonuclease family protein [Planctomycetia bacterium]|nr:thermonuclease family protein [Planctomycetia bacterium]